MRPPLPSRIGKPTRTRRIDGRPLHYTVEEEVSFIAPSNPDKAFYLQKRVFDDAVEFRICYSMIAHKPRMKGKWAFGQFAPMVTAEEMKLLFENAQQKGWL